MHRWVCADPCRQNCGEERTRQCHVPYMCREWRRTGSSVVAVERQSGRKPPAWGQYEIEEQVRRDVREETQTYMARGHDRDVTRAHVSELITVCQCRGDVP